MSHPRISSEEAGQLGYELYDQQIRKQVETEQNMGKIVVIDVETGDYEVDTDAIAATKRAYLKHPGAALLRLRIGYDAVDTFGGSLSQTVKR